MSNLRVMSFNLKYDFKSNDNNEWKKRCERIIKVFKENNPDIIGTQEGLIHMLKDMEEGLNEYAWVGNDRSGEGVDEFNAVFFKKDKFELLEWKQFWLSKTPEVPGSKDFNSSLPRICTEVILRCKKSNKNIVFYNTHLDHESELAREEGIKIIINKVKESYFSNGYPYMIVGDFNCYLHNELFNIVEELEEESVKFNNCYTNIEHSIKGTFHDFKGGYDGDIIDYLLYSEEFKLQELYIDDDLIFGGYPSDHYPVIGDFIINE